MYSTTLTRTLASGRSSRCRAQRRPAPIRRGRPERGDEQIREAEERGAFADLPGAGKPIPDLDKPFDELWWVKAKLKREGLSYLPPSVALRKEAYDALEAAARAKSEAEVRKLVTKVNEKIREANRKGIRGPSLMLMPFDVDEVVRGWRVQRSQKESSPPVA